MKKLSLLLSLLLLFISTLTLYANDNISSKKPINVNNLKIKEKIINANSFTGYSGDATVEVLIHNVDFEPPDGKNNYGIVYKIYIDTKSKNNQKIIFYKSTHAPKLEYSLINGKLKIIYDGKDITKNIKTDKNFFNTYKLYKYPEFFINTMLNSEESFIRSKESSSFLYQTDLKDLIQYYYTMITDQDFIDAVPLQLEVDDKYKVTTFAVADNRDIYIWKNNVPYTISPSIMADNTRIIFLDQNGWIK